MIIFKLINVILGSGLLGLPFIFKQTGILIGMAILTGVCLLILLSGLLMLSRLPWGPSKSVTSLSGHIRKHVSNKIWRYCCVGVIMLGIILQELGSLVSYIYILLDDFNHINPIAINIFLFVFLLWLSMLDLSRLSQFSVFVMLFFLCYKLAFLAFPQQNKCYSGFTNNESDAFNSTAPPVTFFIIWKGTSTCFFATICHTALGSMASTQGVQRTRLSFILGLLCIYFLYAMTSILDLFIFPEIDENILDTFIRCIPGASFVAVFYKVSIMTTIPTLFISVGGEFSAYLNPIFIKAIGLLLAMIIAHFAVSLGWILMIAGFVAGVTNIFLVPPIVFLSLGKLHS